MVISNLTLNFEAGRHYVILAKRGGGKSTLLRLLAGIQRPSSGRITRYGLVSAPLGTESFLRSLDTPKHLIKTLCRIYAADSREVLDSIEAIAGFRADRIRVPFTKIPPVMRLRFGFALGYSLPCDVYLFDHSIGWGDDEFKAKCQRAFDRRYATATTILATSDLRAAPNLGDTFALLDNGRLAFFGSFDEAAEAYHHSLFKDEGQTLAYIEQLIARRQFEIAMALVRKRLAEGKMDAEWLILFAEILLQLDHFEEAYEAASASIELRPSAQAYLMLAIIAEANEDFSQAIQFGEEALAISLDNIEVRHILARCYEKIGSLSAAGETWRHVGENTGGLAAFRYAARNFLVDKNWDQLLILAGTYAQHHPSDPVPYVMRCHALIGLKRWVELVQALHRVALIDPDRALGLIQAVARAEHILISAKLISVMPSSGLASQQSQAVLVGLYALCNRRALAARKAGRDAETEELEQAATLLQSYVNPTETAQIADLSH